jgi:GNAT superfamily N-acetyltransferase
MGHLFFHPLTPATWAAFEDLFGANGACGGCWCMYWRTTPPEFRGGKGEGNRQALKGLVESGDVPGILAFLDERAVGWCSVAPRQQFPGLARARTLKPVDDQPVWSISCLFIRPGYRGKGISLALIRAACEHVAAQGGRLVEAYPVVPKKKVADVFAWTGVASAFERAGFSTVKRPGEARIIVRREVSQRN